MLRNRFTDRVQILLRNLVDSAINEYGDEDETATDYFLTGAVIRAAIVPVASTEDEIDRETLSHQYDVYLDPTVEVYGTSKVLLYADTDDAREARVIGEPQAWRSPRGAQSHIVVRVETISG